MGFSLWRGCSAQVVVIRGARTALVGGNVDGGEGPAQAAMVRLFPRDGKLDGSGETGFVIRLICPAGQITRCGVQPLLQKYFVLRLTQISCLFLAIPSQARGVGHRH
jgi:hypothetical protein